MGVRFFGPADPSDAKHRAVKHSAAIKRALAAPLVAGLIEWHKDVLRTGSCDGSASVDNAPGDARDARALDAAEKRHAASPDGSWSHFGTYLELQ